MTIFIQLQAHVQATDTIIHEGQAPSDKPYRFELSKVLKNVPCSQVMIDIATEKL